MPAPPPDGILDNHESPAADPRMGGAPRPVHTAALALPGRVWALLSNPWSGYCVADFAGLGSAVRVTAGGGQGALSLAPVRSRAGPRQHPAKRPNAQLSSCFPDRLRSALLTVWGRHQIAALPRNCTAAHPEWRLADPVGRECFAAAKCL